MNRHTRSIDGTVPLTAALYEDEEPVTSQDGVGLYDGYVIITQIQTLADLPNLPFFVLDYPALPHRKDKSPEQQMGTIHITSHRLLYIDQSNPRTQSVSLKLSSIRQTDYYAGFLKSSAKVTLYLGAVAKSTSTPNNAEGDDENDAEESRPFQEAWICPVCSYSNPPTASEGAPKCVLCGVTRDMSRHTIAAPSPLPIRNPSIRTSLLSNSLSTSAPSPSILSSRPSVEEDTSDSVPCPACTFLNHKSMRICELCSTPLRIRTITHSKSGNLGAGSGATTSSRSHPSTPTKSQSAAVSRSTTPGLSPESSGQRDSMKISFRKGGDKAFYMTLKKTLMDKAWENKVGFRLTPNKYKLLNVMYF